MLDQSNRKMRDVNADPGALLLLGRVDCCSAATEWVQNYAVFWTCRVDDPIQKANGFLSRIA